MVYYSIEHIKTAVMNYLEQHVTTQKFDIKNLSFDSILNNLSYINKEKVKEAINELEKNDEILIKQSAVKYYVPKNLKNNDNLKPYKLQDTLKLIKWVYFSGFVAFMLLFYTMPSFQQFVLGLKFDKSNVISNSVFLGLLLPVGLGYMLYQTYQKISELLKKVEIRLRLIIVVNVIILIAFFFFNILLERVINIGEIILLVAGVTTLMLTLIGFKIIKLKEDGV